MYNDKTISRYDALISDVPENALYTNFAYNVETKTGPVQRTGKTSESISEQQQAAQPPPPPPPPTH